VLPWHRTTGPPHALSAARTTAGTLSYKVRGFSTTPVSRCENLKSTFWLLVAEILPKKTNVREDN
jgi:hypothetical protein